MAHINEIHHINYVVKDLDIHTTYLEKLLSCKPVIEDLTGRNVKTARFPVGNAWLVVVQPLSDEGEVARILAERGEGLFLLSLGVDSLESSLKQLSKQGIQADSKGPRKGLDTWLIQDLDCPPGLASVLQLCQNSSQ